MKGIEKLDAALRVTEALLSTGHFTNPDGTLKPATEQHPNSVFRSRTLAACAAIDLLDDLTELVSEDIRAESEVGR